MYNWKTTVSGIVTLILVGIKVYATGHIGLEETALITAGLTGIAAKDHNVTGGTKVQVEG